LAEAEPEYPVTLVVRKGGDLRWLGHLDFARAVARALRRAGLALRHSEGFHPRPKIHAPEPLPLGVGSDGERFVVSFAAPIAASRVVELLRTQLPKGLAVVAAAAGAHAEPRDAPLILRLDCEAGGGAGPLFELLDRLKRDGAALAAGFEVEATPRGARVRLLATAGERPSAGRFLTALKPLAQAAGIGLFTADREVPSFAPAPDLQSPAPFSTPDSEADRSGPPDIL
jgi:hypothetical protein